MTRWEFMASERDFACSLLLGDSRGLLELGLGLGPFASGDEAFAVVAGVPEVHAIAPLAMEDAFAEAVGDSSLVEAMGEGAIRGGEEPILVAVLGCGGTVPALAAKESLSGSATDVFVLDEREGLEDFLVSGASVLRHGSLPFVPCALRAPFPVFDVAL